VAAGAPLKRSPRAITITELGRLLLEHWDSGCTANVRTDPLNGRAWCDVHGDLTEEKSS
jgi:hypothetical protein